MTEFLFEIPPSSVPICGEFWSVRSAAPSASAAVLSIEDPRLDFPLRHLNWPAFIRDTGHRPDRVVCSGTRGLEIFSSDSRGISGLVPPISVPDGQLPIYDLLWGMGKAASEYVIEL